MNLKAEPKTLLEATSLIKGTIGDVEIPGSIIVHFALVVSNITQKVSGIVEIIKEVGRPAIRTSVFGSIGYTGYKEVAKIINLSGEYVLSEPSPRIGSYVQRFTAYLDLNDDWNGIGGVNFVNQKVIDVPVRTLN